MYLPHALARKYLNADKDWSEPAALDQEISLGRRTRCVRSTVSVSAMSARRGVHRFARIDVRTRFFNRAIGP